MKQKAYYLLFIREDGQWACEFGDYTRAVVEEERKECRAHHAAKDMRIVKGHDNMTQPEIAVIMRGL